VGVDGWGEPSELEVFEVAAGGAFAFDDFVHLVGVPGRDRGGHESERRGLHALAVERLQADAALVAVEHGVFQGVDAFVLVELVADPAPFRRSGEVAQDELGLDQSGPQ
jgi:hypothetical protein